jgi:FkbH-like protein
MSSNKFVPTIAEVIIRHRNKIALALVQSLANWDKYSADLSDASSHKELAERETAIYVDYLSAYFATGDSTYRSLYIGEKLKQCYQPHRSIDEEIERRRQITAADLKAFLSTAGPFLNEDDCSTLTATLTSINDLLTRRSEKVCRMLLVGDCVYLDLLGTITSQILERGIQLAPTFVTSKLISRQHQEIRQLQGQNFDLIFYSPLTYEFHIEFSQLQSLRAAWRGPSDVRLLVDCAKRDTTATVLLLTSLFECTIFVHNSANIRRHDGTVLDFAKTLLTQPVRRLSRTLYNTWLAAYLEGLRKGSPQVFLLDETSVLRSTSEWQLSRFFTNRPSQHPVGFGRAIAPIYEDIIAAKMILSKKKLIVCDLDNTLWRGLIGEGSVEHLNDRQNTLLALRRKGLLLALCSKNDPRNVVWRGGVLSEADFVCQRINWESKTANIRSIAQTLNLKAKDFVFIDDRADERELVTAALPEITTLDAESDRTWLQLAILASILPENTEGDRTLTYKQREERELFLEQYSTGAADAGTDDAEALAKLHLQLTVTTANKKDLRRVSELINRTNQFNMCNTRTTYQEVLRWHESDRHAILVAEAKDKFGTMGTISVLVLEETFRGVEIIVFVLSCRVFGFGIENALLNRIKQWRPGATIFGHFQETQHNGPCRRAYPENGFSWELNEWVFRGGDGLPDPVWLLVKNEF